MLDELKLLIGIEGTDLDKKLNLLLTMARKRLKGLLGGIEPPEELEYIIIEVANIRFNRIGSEGLSSHSVEGESLTFTNDDFKEFANDIQAFLDRQQEGTRGRLRFL